MQKLKIKEKIKDFLFKNQKVRIARGFINKNISPYFKKSFLLILAILITGFFILKAFNPQYLGNIYNRVSNKAYTYLNLDNYEFTAINIEGNNRIDKQEILKTIHKIQKDFIAEISDDKNLKKPSLIKKLAIEIKESQDWIDSISVSRTLPNALNIKIVEYEPFAIWQKGKQKYVIDRDGDKIKIENDDDFKYLIILSGKNANLHVKSLFNMLAINPEISAKIYSATWVGDRRWNVRFENGLLVKLPSSNLFDAWKDLIRIYNTPGATKNLISIDLRIDKKIYLKYNGKRIEEILNYKFN